MTAATYGNKLSYPKVMRIKGMITDQGYKGTFYIIKDIIGEGEDQKYIIHALNSMINLINHSISHTDIKFKGNNSGLIIGDILELNRSGIFGSTYTKNEDLSNKSRQILASTNNSSSPSSLSLLTGRVGDAFKSKKDAPNTQYNACLLYTSPSPRD